MGEGGGSLVHTGTKVVRKEEIHGYDNTVSQYILITKGK